MEELSYIQTLRFKYHNQLGLNAFVTGENRRAEKHFLKLIALFPEREGLHYNCALAQMGLKKFDQAEELLLREIARFGDSYVRRKTLGDLYYISGNFPAALKTYQHCRHMDGANADLRLLQLRSDCCRDPERYVELRRSLGCYERGAVLVRSDPEVAETLLKEAVRLDPSNFLVLNNLGVIAMNHRREYPTAYAYFQQSLELSAQPVVQQNLNLVQKAMNPPIPSPQGDMPGHCLRKKRHI